MPAKPASDDDDADSDLDESTATVSVRAAAKQKAKDNAERKAEAARKLAERNHALELLRKRTAQDRPDIKRDYNWAWKHQGLPDISPKVAPSVPAYRLYELSCDDHPAFLTKFHAQKRETDRLEGTAGREAEADREARLNALDKLAEAVAPECEALLEDLLRLYPEECDNVLIRHGWKRYVNPWTGETSGRLEQQKEEHNGD